MVAKWSSQSPSGISQVLYITQNYKPLSAPMFARRKMTGNRRRPMFPALRRRKRKRSTHRNGACSPPPPSLDANENQGPAKSVYQLKSLDMHVRESAREGKSSQESIQPQTPSKVLNKIPNIKVENSYRMGPEPGEKFKSEPVRLIIQKTLDNFLRTFSYSNAGAKRMATLLSNEIRLRAGDMEFKRYKMVCNVIMMQNRTQGAVVASRCIWSTDTDSFASVTFTSNEVICIANLHAVYYE